MLQQIAVGVFCVACLIAAGVGLRWHGKSRQRRLAHIIKMARMDLAVLRRRLDETPARDGDAESLRWFVETSLPLAETALDFENFSRCYLLRELCRIALDWANFRERNALGNPCELTDLVQMSLVRARKAKYGDADECLRSLWKGRASVTWKDGREVARGLALRAHIAVLRAQGYFDLANEQEALLRQLPAIMESGLVTGFTVGD